MIALFLVLPVIRGDFLYSHRIDPLTAINLLLIFYLTAAFATMGLGANSLLMGAPTFILAAIVIALANINVSRYGELAVIALAVFGAMNLYSASGVMGFRGFLLILCSSLGVLFAVDVTKVVASLRARNSDPQS